MKTRKNLLTASTVVGALACAVYVFFAAVYYSLSDKIYILFATLGVLSLVQTVLVSSLKTQIKDEGFSVAVKKKLTVYACIGVVAIPTLVLCFLARCLKVNDELSVEKPVETSTVKEAEMKPFFKRKNTIVAIVSIVLVFLFSFCGMLVENNGFDVKIDTFTLTKEMTEEYNTKPINGKSYVITNDCLEYEVNVYVPHTATDKNPSPTVFVLPGFTRTKETMTQYCIELARRGAVAFCIDPACQGGSTWAGYKLDDQGNVLLDENGEPVPYSSSVDSNGLNYLVQYVYNNIEEYGYVDRNRIGLVGHSQGALNVIMTTQKFSGSSFEKSIIKAMAITGYVNGISGRFQNIHANSLMSYGYYDEGYYNSSFESTAKRFLNDVNGANTNAYVDINLDTPYGNVKDGSYRIIHREKINHCFQMYDSQSISNLMTFFGETLSFETDLTPDNQVWHWKEIFNGLALVCAFTFIICLTKILADTKVFKSVKSPVAEPSRLPDLYPKRYAKKSVDKIIFWVTTLVTAVIACLDYYPLSEWSTTLFSKAYDGVYTFVFPAKMLNAVMLWATVNGLIGIFLFFGTVMLKNLHEKIRAKRLGIAPTYDFEQFKPLKIKPLNLLKTLLLSFVIFAIFSLLTQICMWIFHQDFRFFAVSAGIFQWRNMVALLIYIPFFFIFYMSNSIRVNCGIAFEGWSEWKTLIVGGLANSVGLMGILLVHYSSFVVTGQVYFSLWLYINMVFGIVPMMFLLPIWNRLIYKKTGNVYLGAMTSCLIFIMMTLSASVNYIPL